MNEDRRPVAGPTGAGGIGEGTVADDAAIASDDAVTGDETVMVDDATVVTGDETVMVDDATVVASDATVVVARAPSGGDDGGGDDGTGDGAAGEEDSESMGGGDLPAEDLTMLAPHLGFDDATVVSQSHSAVQNSGSLADYMSGGSRSASVGDTGLDPERRIADLPDRMPWEAVPAPEQGVHQGLPVVYGPRNEGDDDAPVGVDEVIRRVGPPPGATPVPVRQGRESLPSLTRRERKTRTLTLIVYGAVVVVAVLGLIGIARLAFG